MSDVTDILVGVDKLLSEHGFCEMASARHQLSIAISLHNQRLNEAHRHADESAKDAHRRGWEQAKREAVGYLIYQHNLVVGEASLDYLATLEQCWSAIASIEYKEGE